MGRWVARVVSGTRVGRINEYVSMASPCPASALLPEATQAGRDQAEIDRYWEALSAVPEAEQCGWLKDRFGLSWQIVPAAMDGMMTNGSPEQIARVTQAFLKMKKFSLADLQRAYAGA